MERVISRCRVAGIGVLVLLFAAGLASAASAAGGDGDERFYVTVSSAYAKAAPAGDSAAVFSVFWGQDYRINQYSPDGAWVQLHGWGQVYGWLPVSHGTLDGASVADHPPIPLPDIPTGVLPQVGAVAREYYRQGLALGSNPAAFSKLGDCNTENGRFLVMFDTGEYRLGPHFDQLQPAINHFAGSFERESLAANSGFSADSLLDPIWANPQQCGRDESPLACELRLHRPSLALVNLGTHSPPSMNDFESSMRRLIEATLAEGVLPILATKADNVEGDGRINVGIRHLAEEYELPLWDFWAAVQPLPAHGLSSDGIHFTYGRSHFDDPWAMTRGWTWRNLTALLALDAVWQGVGGGPATASPAWRR
jgi:hypothetical protein